MEAIVDAMDSFSDQAMVQLSALLCMIPLALENPMMQVCLNRRVPFMDCLLPLPMVQPHSTIRLCLLIGLDENRLSRRPDGSDALDC